MNIATKRKIVTTEFSEYMLESEKGLYVSYVNAPLSPLELEKFLYLDIFRKLLKNFANCLLLNVGCGRDVLFSNLQEDGAEIIEVDIVKAPLRELKTRGAKNVILADAYHLPFKDNTFDLAFTIGVLHHLLLIKNAALEVVRVAKQEKYVLFSEPNKLYLFTKIIELLPHRATYYLRSQLFPVLFSSYTPPASYERTLDPEEIRRAIKDRVTETTQIFDSSPQIVFYSGSSLLPKLWNSVMKITSREKNFGIVLSYKFMLVCRK